MNKRERKLKHSDLLYDYIKFHLGLYLATPPAISIVSVALKLDQDPLFQSGMIGMIAIYFIVGSHASWFIAKHINTIWLNDGLWEEFGESASCFIRRSIHHYSYWAGLALVLLGLAGSYSLK